MKGISRTVRRRRKEGKTDYKLRRGLLRSGKPRVVFRKTNRYIIGQIVASDVAQDKVVSSVNSKEIVDFGWPKEMQGSLKNLSACYLTGFLLGKKTKEVKEAIFDMGLNRNIKKSRAYAFLSGVVDGGIAVPHSKEILPEMKEILEDEKAGKLIEKIKDKMNAGGKK